MGSIIVGLLPLIVGAAVVPIWIIMVLLLLSDKGGLLKVRVCQRRNRPTSCTGHPLWLRLPCDAAASGDEGASLIVWSLLLVVGILMLITAFKQWRKEMTGCAAARMDGDAVGCWR